MNTLPLEERYLEGYELTRADKAEAVRFAEETVQATAADPDLERIIEAHRRRLDIGQVQRLSRLCFPVRGAEDHRGRRFVLWRPLVDFIQDEFEFEIEDWLCEGEVALAFLSHEAARFVEALCPRIEEARVNNPYRSERSIFVVALNPLLELKLELRDANDPTAEKADRIYRRVNQRVRSAPTADPRTELAAIAVRSPQWAVVAALEFLRRFDPESKSDSLALSLVSEAVLAQDWLRPEEEEAWRNL